MKFTRLFRMLALCAAWLFAQPALADGADLESATAEDKAKASTHYTQGMASFQAGDAAGALAEFEQSYQAVKSPNSHLMIGKALIDLARYVEAHRELTETLEEAREAESIDPKYAQTRLAAEEELARVESQVVRLSVSLSGAGSNARVRVNGTEYSRAELESPLIVPPGPVEVELIEGGSQVSSQSLTGRAGEALDVSLAKARRPAEAGTAAPAPSPSVVAEKRPFPHRRETAYVAGGLGIAGALTFGVFGLLNNAKYSDIEEQCNDRVCSSDQASDAERGHTYQTMANVGLIVGVVGLGTAVALILTEDEGATAKRNATRVSLGPGRIHVKGTF